MIAWRKSRYCMAPDQTCVQVAVAGDAVLVSDSKDPNGPVLRFTHDEWHAFAAGVRSGEFEPAALALAALGD